MKLFAITTVLALVSVHLTASAKPTHGHVDPCSTLARFNGSLYPPSMVKACYLSIPFDKAMATQILDTVSTIYANFYTFLDMAKTKPAKGFAFKPVDVLAGLKKIRQTAYKTDYDFNNAITQLTQGLHDAHANYWSTCYTAYHFQQPIYLYAPVINNRQSVRVFHVDPTFKVPGGRNLTDCEVLQIDGKPAIKTIVEFADTQDEGSKDPGVRLNDVLAGYTLIGTNDFMFWPGTFTRRRFLPAADTMDYVLQCPKSKQPLKLSVPWKGYEAIGFNFNFTSSKTFWQSNCAAVEATALNKPAAFNEQGKPFMPKVAVGTPAKDGLVKDKFPFADAIAADLLFVGNFSRFYKLENGVGVAMISTEAVQYWTTGNWDYLDTITGFQKLADAGVKKLVLDLVNNGGGYVDYGLFVASLLFPNTLATFPQDMRASKLGQALGKVAFANPTSCSAWNSRNYVEFNPKQTRIESDIFVPGIPLKRAGDTLSYSREFSLGYGWPFLPKPFPWKNTDIAIFTNGACGSACVLIASHLKYYNNVRTAAIGGFQKVPLSAVSFPGGFVYDMETFLQDWQVCNLNLTLLPVLPKALPIQSVFRVPISEFYRDTNATVPLEYVPLKADVHLDYTPENARDPSAAWREVASKLLM